MRRLIVGRSTEEGVLGLEGEAFEDERDEHESQVQQEDQDLDDDGGVGPGQ